MRRVDWGYAAFLIGTPIAIGVMLGANQLRAGAYLPWALSVGYWTALSVATWFIFAGTTWCVARVLKPWSPPAPVSWLLGALIGSLLARQAIYWIAELFRPAMREGPLREMPPASLSIDFLVYYATNWSVIILIWMLANWALALWRGLEARRTGAGGLAVTGEARAAAILSPEELAAAASFLDRLPAYLPRDVIALQSEDHYVRVHTRGGDTLVLGALSDAINAIEGRGVAGQRVHRSWWVATAAVAECRADGRKLVAVLSNGLEVPISQTYRELARLAGIVAGGKGAAGGAAAARSI